MFKDIKIIKVMFFFISPPFGNYINLPNTICIEGSYTLEPRGGLIIQILKTFRYSFKHEGWINKIGLRNKGIDYAIKNYNGNNIVSIAILKESDIDALLKKIPKDMNLEINISCPNVDKKLISNHVNKFINNERNWCILKLSPTTSIQEIDTHYKNGFRQFHCSNTLSIEGRGGLSGTSLIPYTNDLIEKIRNKYPDTKIIAGGGVRNINTYNNYIKNGANYISVSTLCLNPLLFFNLYRNVYNQHYKQK